MSQPKTKVETKKRENMTAGYPRRANAFLRWVISPVAVVVFGWVSYLHLQNGYLLGSFAAFVASVIFVLLFYWVGRIEKKYSESKHGNPGGERENG